MAFLRVEKKKSGTYLRIVQSTKIDGVTRHKTLHSMGKIEDYPPEQLERIATKLLELAGARIEDIVAGDLEEVRRVNYGYALVIKELWRRLELDKWMRKVNNTSRIRFDWLAVLELMIAERLNEPCSKRASHQHQQEYIGFADSSEDQELALNHFYRTLDILSAEQESLKKHLFKAQQSLFSSQLDVVFYDVTTLYFDSQLEQEDSLRQKGFSKDGKAHKTQIVLGLLVDKLRNPITYNIYRGNTYEGHTMRDAIEQLKKQYSIDKVVVVADSAMIDRDNRDLIDDSPGVDYIIGDRLKSLPKSIQETLMDRSAHQRLGNADKEVFSYTKMEHQGRTIICTYSQKRARKDQYQREKLVAKAERLIQNSSKLKQSKKRGAGRYIEQTGTESYALDQAKIDADARWDGFKAISTTSKLEVSEVLEKYADLFEVEHAFRTLKSQLEIRPMFHWTNKRIEGHIAMCFMSYTMLNYMKQTTKLSQKAIVRAIDQMQMSEVKETKSNDHFFLRSKISPDQQQLINTLKLVVPKDTTPQRLVNQYFTKMSGA